MVDLSRLLLRPGKSLGICYESIAFSFFTFLHGTVNCLFIGRIVPLGTIIGFLIISSASLKGTRQSPAGLDISPERRLDGGLLPDRVVCG
jgi:hypothetical protein